MIKDVKYAAVLAAVTVISLGAFAAMYLFDNKYTYASDGEYTGEEPVIFLVNGWEIFEDKLLTPKDITGHAPDKTVYIGQYAGFEFGDKTKNPHGSTTYRINVKLPPGTEEYTLELPEIFSSYYLYVNGVLEASSGNTSHSGYKDLTQNKIAVFSAGVNAEIIIGVTDFSHIYSGLVYPPAFGTGVTELLNTRLFFRSMLIFIPISIGLIYLALGMLVKEKKHTVYFFLMCMFFIGYTCYPVVHTFFATAIRPWYTLESFSYFAFIWIVVRLQGIICGTGGKARSIFEGMSSLMCVISVVYPSLVIKDSLGYMYAYSSIIELYKYAICGYSIVSTWSASKKGNINAKALLAGLLVFGCSLLADRLLPMFEPIRFGWFSEAAGFVLVCVIGGIICADSIHAYRQNGVLKEGIAGAENLIDMQKRHYLEIKDRIEESKKTFHDFRHNLLLIRSYAEAGRNEKIIEFVDLYIESGRGMSDIMVCRNDTVNAILSYYIKIAGREGIKIDVRVNLPEKLPFSDPDLCVIFGNLMENAVEACRRSGPGSYISVRAKNINNSTVITVDNSFDGNTSLRGSTFLSSKRNGQAGIGIPSVRAVADKYGGSAVFETDGGNGIFKSSVILPFN